jgi:hypothetical protein
MTDNNISVAKAMRTSSHGGDRLEEHRTLLFDFRMPSGAVVVRVQTTELSNYG